METRKQIEKRLTELHVEEKALRDKCDVLGYKEKFETNNKYVGKCYKEIQKRKDDWIRCFYVYGIDIETCQLNAIEVRYYKDKPDVWFNIEYSHNFYPIKKDYEEYAFSEYKKITKEEFDKHFSMVIAIINKVVKTQLIKKEESNQFPYVPMIKTKPFKSITIKNKK